LFLSLFLGKKDDGEKSVLMFHFISFFRFGKRLKALCLPFVFIFHFLHRGSSQIALSKNTQYLPPSPPLFVKTFL